MVQFELFSLFCCLVLQILGVVFGVVLVVVFLLFFECLLILGECQQVVCQVVEVVYGVVVYFYVQVVLGKMIDDEVKKVVFVVVCSLCYGGNEYFWINDMMFVMIMYFMKLELEGQLLIVSKDLIGKLLFVVMVDIVKVSGVGYLFYMWFKFGS